MVNEFALKRGLEIFGDKADEFTVKTSKQIHDIDTYATIDAKTLTWEERPKAILDLFFRTEKGDGTVKGCKYAVGSE